MEERVTPEQEISGGISRVTPPEELQLTRTLLHPHQRKKTKKKKKEKKKKKNKKNNTQHTNTKKQKKKHPKGPSSTGKTEGRKTSKCQFRDLLSIRDTYISLKRRARYLANPVSSLLTGRDSC